MEEARQKIEALEVEFQQKSLENDILKKKVIEFEKQQKYEEERIKSATLQVELEAKVKDQQIERLNKQLSIYEQKFSSLIASPRNVDVHLNLNKNKENRLSNKSRSSNKGIKDKIRLTPRNQDLSEQIFDQIVLKNKKKCFQSKKIENSAKILNENKSDANLIHFNNYTSRPTYEKNRKLDYDEKLDLT